MHRQVKGKKTIAKALGMSKTAQSSLTLISLSCCSVQKEAKTALDSLLALDEPQLKVVFHAGNPAYKDDIRYDQLQEKRDYIIGRFTGKVFTKYLLQEEY